MDFRLEDFTPEIQETIKRYHEWVNRDNSVYNGAIATLCNLRETINYLRFQENGSIFQS